MKRLIVVAICVALLLAPMALAKDFKVKGKDKSEKHNDKLTDAEKAIVKGLVKNDLLTKGVVVDEVLLLTGIHSDSHVIIGIKLRCLFEICFEPKWMLYVVPEDKWVEKFVKKLK